MPEANADPSASHEGIPATAHLVAVLAHSLTTQCSPTRAPDNFEASLETACSAPENSLSRALLRANFQVWFAYFLASQQGAAPALGGLLPPDFALVTGQVANITPHQSVKKLFSHLFHGQGWRSKKRQGKQLSNYLPLMLD